MGVHGDVLLRISAEPDDDTGELDELTRRLRSTLLGLDVTRVDPVTTSGTPDGAKGLSAVAGWLAVHLGEEALRRVLETVLDWASRNGRTVEATIDGNSLKLGRAGRDEQRRIVDAWLARQTPST
jgi:hypothetical protein